MFDLRYYQNEAVQATYREWERVQSTAIIAATATGKTEIYLSIATSYPGRVLIIAHRDYLLGQPIARLAKHGFDDVAVEKADQRSENGIIKSKVVFASVQSLCKPDRLKTFNPFDFAVVIIDEGHRAVAKTYRTILDHFKLNSKLRVLILTATPKRKDGIALGTVADSVAYVYGPKTAIQEGWIVPLRFYRREVPDLDFSTVKLKGSDLDQDQVEALLMQEKPLHVVCSSLAEDRGPTVIFCPGVNVARAYSTLMNKRYRPDRSAVLWADSEQEEREIVGKKLAQGELDYLFNVDLVCLDGETEILTSSGWAGMNDISENHLIANWDWDGTIFFKRPKSVVFRRRWPGERMVSLNGSRPAMAIRVTEDHRMVCRTHKRGKWKIEHAHEIADKVREFPVCGVADPFPMTVEQEDKSITGAKIRQNSYVLRKNGMDAESALATAVERLEQRAALQFTNPCDLTLDECKLIGFWLGDGSKDNLIKGGVEYKLSQATKSENIVKEIERLLTACRLHFVRRDRVNNRGTHYAIWSIPRGTGFGPQQREGIYRLEPYLNKTGTELFWALSAEQFKSLLCGLWMADGVPHNDRIELPTIKARIVGKHKCLFDLLQAVGVCRGISMGIRELHSTNPKHCALYHLTIYNRKAHRVGKNPMTIDTEPWKDEPIWCVTSHTGNIVIRRRGTVMVTGNTEGYDVPELVRVVWAAPTASLVRFTQGTGRVFRTHSSLRSVLTGERAEAEVRQLQIQQSPKPLGMVVTYYPQNCKHQLCEPNDILGGEDLPTEVKAYAKQIQEATAAQPNGSDPDEDVETAQAVVELRTLLEKRREKIRAEATVRDTEYDAFGGSKNRSKSGDAHEEKRVAKEISTDWPNTKPASDKQIGWLKANGIRDADTTWVTSWRAFVVRQLVVDYKVDIKTAMSYGKNQALAVLEKYKAAS